MNRPVLALALGIVLLSACGGAPTRPSPTPAQPSDLNAAWATAVKLAVDHLRSEHLSTGGSQSDLDSAATLVTNVCGVAIDDLKASNVSDDSVQRACEAALRAAATPRISAAPIYEGAYAALASAGSELSLATASDPSQRRIARALLPLYGPPLNLAQVATSGDTGLLLLSELEPIHAAGHGLDAMCRSILTGLSITPLCLAVATELAKDPART